MPICKCKMCGGDLHIEETDKIIECDYCGTTQTVPSADNEKKMALFNRANRLRLNNEFDKAAGIYESIVAEFPEEAEAYWGIVLCKYGIEYVDDPATGKKIPTCHRSSFESVFEDDAFDQACENADAGSRRIYRDEAKQIEEIRKGILEVSSKEEPYDIFICYKETDENGDRTIDSVIAQDVYDALTEKSYRVFFSRITLEDKLGQEYEPYIFAALHSAKVMLVFGTDFEYFNAVWVKNEWSRFLQLISSGQKKVLIPCYKGIDAYDMPKEFAKLQSQDMGKVGAIQDLLRGIEKLLPRSGAAAQPAPVQTAVPASPAGATVDSLLKRAFMFLEDENWQSADEYAEKVLDIDPENGEAYLAKAMAELNVRQRTDLSKIIVLTENANLKKTLRFGTETLKAEVNGYLESARAVAEKKRKEREAREEAERKAIEVEKEVERRALEAKRRQIAIVQHLIGAGFEHAVGVKKDGTVVAVGNNGDGQCNVSDWKNIVAISAGGDNTVGLKKDGTVVAVGENDHGECNVSGWKDIVAISMRQFYIIGLKKDRTVVAVGYDRHGKRDVSGWKDIVAISAGDHHTVGLKKDGTVVAVGSDMHGQCDVSGWKDIVAVNAGGYHTAGLKNDGTVVASGRNKNHQCDVSDWKDIVAVNAGYEHTVGLKKDGTVVAVGNNDSGQCNVSSWKDIVAVSAGDFHTVGLKKDGTVVAVGDNDVGQCNVSGWKLFNDYRTFEKEQKESIEAERAAREAALAERAAREVALKKKRAEHIASLRKEKAALETELPTLTGLFKAFRRKEVETRLAEIERELNNLTE